MSGIEHRGSLQKLIATGPVQQVIDIVQSVLLLVAAIHVWNANGAAFWLVGVSWLLLALEVDSIKARLIEGVMHLLALSFWFWAVFEANHALFDFSLLFMGLLFLFNMSPIAVKIKEAYSS